MEGSDFFERMPVIKETPLQEIEGDISFLLTCPAVTSCKDCTERLQGALRKLGVAMENYEGINKS